MASKPRASLSISVSGWTHNINEAHARIQDTSVTLSELTNDPSRLLTDPYDFDELDLHVSAQCLPKVLCEVQDLLFALLPRLVRGHLRKLNASLCIVTPTIPAQGPSEPLIDKNEERGLTKQARMLDLRNIRPGQISELHAVAFLLDPIRWIRGLHVRGDGEEEDTQHRDLAADDDEDDEDDERGDELEYEVLDEDSEENSKGSDVGDKLEKEYIRVADFTLKFEGSTISPWNTLRPRIRSLLRGDEPPGDYAVFRPYFQHLRALNQAMSAFLGIRDEKAVKAMDLNLLSLCEHRIRGSVRRFRARHNTVIDLVDGVIREQARKRLTDEAKDARSEVKKLRNKLGKVLPGAKVDVSFLGYNEANTALAARRDADAEERITRKRGRGDSPVDNEDTQEPEHTKKRKLIDELASARKSRV